MFVWDLSVGDVSVGEMSVKEMSEHRFIFHLFRVFLCSCTGSATDLRVLLLLLDVFYLILFFDIWHKLLLSRPLGAGNSSLKVAGPPVEVRNIDWTHLFV